VKEEYKNPFSCPYAGRALTFFLQQKKVSKKCRRRRKRAKKIHCFTKICELLLLAKISS
jgi:hypothetical protein